MRFERLELQNFASYYGEHSIDLSCQPEKPVVVILGGTGYGKTSLFDALNWALYGEDYERQLQKRRRRDITDYVNETALREAMSNGWYVPMSATLYFEHDGEHFYITQELSVKPVKTSTGAVSAEKSDRTTTLYEIALSGNHRALEYNSIFLDQILPNNVRDYFLFDGDRIYYLSNAGASQEVRDAIYRVVDLELVKNAIRHLNEVATDYRRDAKRESSDELSKVEEDYGKVRDTLARLKEALATSRGEEQSIKSRIAVHEDKLANLPDTSKKQAERTALLQRIETTERELDNLSVEIRGLIGPAASDFALPAISLLMEDLESRRAKGQIPRKVSQTLLKDLLQLEQCICGTQFVEGDPVYHTLMERLREEQGRGTGQELLELNFQLRSLVDTIDEATTRLRAADGRRDEYRSARREFDMALKQIDIELASMPQEDVAQITQELRRLREDLQTTTRKEQQAADQIVRCEDLIRVYEKKREELGKKQSNVRRVQQRERLAQRAADTLDGMYEQFAEESRKAIEELTREEFKKFVLSSSEYQVALTEDYELRILDSNGNPALQRLSMGQSQCLSLAFITAISRVSEKNPPIAIDMPFGRLDPQVHKQVSKRLPEITSQLILFLIPQTEWHEATASNLSPKASHIYRLDFDEKNRSTTIVETK